MEDRDKEKKYKARKSQRDSNASAQGTDKGEDVNVHVLRKDRTDREKEKKYKGHRERNIERET